MLRKTRDSHPQEAFEVLALHRLPTRRDSPAATAPNAPRSGFPGSLRCLDSRSAPEDSALTPSALRRAVSAQRRSGRCGCGGLSGLGTPSATTIAARRGHQRAAPNAARFSSDLRHNRLSHRTSGAKKCALAKQLRQNAPAFFVDKERFGKIDDRRAVASIGRVCFQECSSSLAHSPTNLPSTRNVRASGLSCMVIRSMRSYLLLRSRLVDHCFSLIFQPIARQCRT